jgi:hypothetical protein
MQDRASELLRITLLGTPLNKGKRMNGSLTHWDVTRGWGSLLAINSRQKPSEWMATIPSACTTPTASRSRLESLLPSRYAHSFWYINWCQL